jgi:uncharacterized protein YuzE
VEKVRQFTGDIPGWTMDYEADAAYLKLRSGEVSKTVAYDVVNLDLDDNGRVIGVELLTLRPLPPLPKRNTGDVYPQEDIERHGYPHG